MSADTHPQTTPQSHGNRKNIRRIAILSLTGIFIVLAILYLIYWLLVLRHFESTDDAYAMGNQVHIMAQVSGSVTDIKADSTDFVKAGNTLVSIDPTDAEQAFERAKTSLADSVRQAHQTLIEGKLYKADIASCRVQLQQAEANLKRREMLEGADAISHEELQHARDAVKVAQAKHDAAIQKYSANQAMVMDTPIAQQPQVLQAAAQVREAWLAVQRTQIRSPIDGFISRRSVQIGQRITPATSLMVVVPAHQIWIDANFKETQLKNIRIGQTATVTSDIYGDGVQYHGKVVGIDMGTGSAFSVLPAQNATGNWIKVVQRIPVRIELDEQEVATHPLRIGLSVTATIDTHNRDGQILSETTRTESLYRTSALAVELAPVNALIADIIRDNMEGALHVE